MNISEIEIQWSDGKWLAMYSPCRTTRRETVTDAKGQPIRYSDARDAKIAAYEALFAAENRIEALRFTPGQIAVPPKFYEARSRAGKKRFAEQQLKEAMREAAQ